MKRITSSPVERFLYLTLLLTFVALSALSVVLYQSNQRLNNQIRENRDVSNRLEVLANEQQHQTKIIICMLQVPVSQRTTSTEAACRKQSIVTRATPSSLAVTVPLQSSKVFVSSPSPQSAPNITNKQADSPPQPKQVQSCLLLLLNVCIKP